MLYLFFVLSKNKNVNNADFQKFINSKMEIEMKKTFWTGIVTGLIILGITDSAHSTTISILNSSAYVSLDMGVSVSEFQKLLYGFEDWSSSENYTWPGLSGATLTQSEYYPRVGADDSFSLTGRVEITYGESSYFGENVTGWVLETYLKSKNYGGLYSGEASALMTTVFDVIGNGAKAWLDIYGYTSATRIALLIDQNTWTTYDAISQYGSLEVDLLSGHRYSAVVGISSPPSDSDPTNSARLFLSGAEIEIIPSVPEPAAMLLMGTGLAGLIGARRKKKA